MPAPVVTNPSVIVPVAGVADTGSNPGVNDPVQSPRRKLVDSAVAKYEGLILARPEAAAAAAALLAFDGRPADALALVEKHPALATRLKAAAGVAVLRAGPTSDAQAAKVKTWLDAALAEEPDSIAVKLTHAEYLAHRQDYAAAEKVYDAVLAADPANVVALNNLAWLLAPNPVQAAKALDLVERAAAQSGLTAELLDTRARVRIAARQPALAEQDALQALAREPTPLRYFHLAMAKRAGRPPKADEARDAFKAAKARGLAAYMVHPADLAALRTFDAGD
jgi:Tfp pilus assembly protein PilF